jgi:aconitate hydratase
MEPRFLGVRAILVKSFARIHETNLKKQGMLALTFADKSDYDKVREDDTIDILGLDRVRPGQAAARWSSTTATARRTSSTVNHSYNEGQIEWFKAGSALNLIKAQANA